MRRFLIPLLIMATALFSASAFAQPATAAQRAGVTPKADYGTLHLEAPIGAFRLIDGEGRVEISFRGSVLVSSLQGKVTVGPGVKKEVTRGTREVYFGQGTIVVTGKWRAVQWFGGNMRAVWYGRGLARVTGEFDRNLNPGRYWYDDPSKKFFWFPNSAITITLPQQVQGKPQSAPKRRGR